MKKLPTVLIITLLGAVVLSCTINSEITFPTARSIRLDPADSSVVTLNYNSTICLNNNFFISFKNVASDSRCPIDVMCFWAGDAEIVLKLQNGFNEKFISLHSYLFPQEVVFENYSIRLLSVNPLPKSGVEIKKYQYQIKLMIRNTLGRNIRPVIIMEPSDSWLLKKDALEVNNISFTNNLLYFETKYSGGCNEHTIELFARKENTQSSPPQIVLTLSHDARGDNCKAIISRKVVFDLMPLQKYFAITCNYGGKIKIVIVGPDGKTINGQPIDFDLQSL